MHQGLSRLCLGLALALFCFPLFIGLGGTDLENDEAIYSFAVDRILETGEWLTPKSSPYEDAAFLEKPPLKFWIVAAPILVGVLPHSEFGIRFWDALFGAAAFLYVFAIGSRLAGPVCGIAAVLILFVHRPLLFDHGFRSNNMEASLVLCYCGGVFHYLRWTAAADGRWRRGHAVAAGLYFVLGFMTKFVAALFLPLAIVAASLLFRAPRIRLASQWRVWGGVAALTLALVVPWFVYATMRFGWGLWHIMLTDHVYVRFTSYLDATHLQPWNFYFTELYRWFAASDSHLPVLAGLALLVVQTIRRRWLDGAVVVLWFALPLLLMSLGTSKLYHYVYPFLPPLALAGGYLGGFAVTLAPAPLARGLQALHDYLAARVPTVVAISRRPAVRWTTITIAVAAAVVAALTLIGEPIRIVVGRSVLFRSSGVVRPILAVALFGVLAGECRRASRVVVALLVASVLPLQAYRDTVKQLTIERHPLRSASRCVADVERRRVQAGGEPNGLYVDADRADISHPQNYYFRRIRPWEYAVTPAGSVLSEYVNRPAAQRPVLIADRRYHDFVNRRGFGAEPPPWVHFNVNGLWLLLPGPYGACSVAATGAVAMRQ